MGVTQGNAFVALITNIIIIIVYLSMIGQYTDLARLQMGIHIQSLGSYTMKVWSDFVYNYDL